MAKRKRIKRKPGRKSKYYFKPETDEAIAKWQKSEDQKEKDKLFEEEIMPAITALVDNLVWTYKFKCPRESIESMKTDCVTFLFESLHKWDPTRGAKAFSYYNITAKRWLISQSQKYIKVDRRHVGTDDKDVLSPLDKVAIEQHSVMESPDDVIRREDLQFIIDSLMKELNQAARNENEINVAAGIKYMFENIDRLDIINKRSVLVYLREITGLKQPQLSSALFTLRKRYRELTGRRGIFAYEFWEDDND